MAVNRLSAESAVLLDEEVRSSMPALFDRSHEAAILALCASGSMEPMAWRSLGSSFFMAGIAVMLASVRGMNRERHLALAETLCPGSTRREVFGLWLRHSPLRPARFIPMLRARVRHANSHAAERQGQ